MANLEKLECHFTWDLGQYRNELKGRKRSITDVNQETHAWLVHYHNLMGFIQFSLGSSTEALKNLHEAERVIQENPEAEVRLQVTKANLAWVYFNLGDMEKSKEYLDDVERLQRTHPAPPGCPLHPEVSGEKGWTLVKFNKPRRRQAIDYFRMALKAEPERKEWHKGLAVAMSRGYTVSEITPELEAEILEQVKTAAEKNPDDLFLQSLYVLKKYEMKGENHDEDVERLLERTIETGNFEGLSNIFRYYRRDSSERGFNEAERVQENFPTSNNVNRIIADLYKWKVFMMKDDSEERETLARKSIELFEKVVRDFPHSSKYKIALASLYCYAHNIERADEIYQQLLSEEDDLAPHRQQHLYYSYACFLYHHKRSSNSTRFYMKAAEVPEMTDCKLKSIRVLKNIVRKGRDPHCREICRFLQRINAFD